MELTEPHVKGVEAIRTPALVIDMDAVSDNITATLRLLDGNPDRWRPHLKTAKLALTMRRIRASGVLQAKCATTLELETACAAGFEDVLLAYPTVGPHVDAVRDLAGRFPAVKITALVEAPEMLDPWRGSRVGLFVELQLVHGRVDQGIARSSLAPSRKQGISLRALLPLNPFIGRLERTPHHKGVVMQDLVIEVAPDQF